VANNVIDFMSFHRQSLSYNTITRTWLTHDMDNKQVINDNDINETSMDAMMNILPPELPTISMSDTPRSVMTRNGLWIMALSDDNRLLCYNCKLRSYSTLTISQPYVPTTKQFTRPNCLLPLSNGWILMISWHRHDQLEGKGPFQLLDPQTSMIHYFDHHGGGNGGVQLPTDGLKNCEVAIIDCDHTVDDKQYIIIGNGGFEMKGQYSTNKQFWCATIQPVSTTGPRIGRWKEFDITSSIPPTFNGISLRGVLD
jgi:hypothetical protein